MWVFLFVTASLGQAPPMLITDYSGGPTQGEAWIKLVTPTRDWELQRLVWCKSLVPNDQNPAPLPHDCVGQHLMRIQLYPGNAAGTIVTEPPASAEDEPTSGGNVYYVDPIRVGGWDSRHQWIMEMELKRHHHDAGKTPTTMIEVVRFNPLSPLLVGNPTIPPATPATETEMIATTPIAASISSTSEPAKQKPETQTPQQQGESVPLPWLGFGVILGAGVCVIGVGVLLYHMWKRQPRLPRPYGDPSLHYDWTKGHSVDDVDEETRLREEDLQILSKMNN